MTATRDLVEAEAFERRRRIHAFVSGDATARLDNLPHPGRALLLGAILALLICAGVAAQQLL
jgi:hypothetical protein